MKIGSRLLNLNVYSYFYALLLNRARRLNEQFQDLAEDKKIQVVEIVAH